MILPTCEHCTNSLICADQGECMHLFNQRIFTRRILDQLSVGERFVLMFGRGELKYDPLRVEWKETEETKDDKANPKP